MSFHDALWGMTSEIALAKNNAWLLRPMPLAVCATRAFTAKAASKKAPMEAHSARSFGSICSATHAQIYMANWEMLASPSLPSLTSTLVEVADCSVDERAVSGTAGDIRERYIKDFASAMISSSCWVSEQPR